MYQIRWHGRGGQGAVTAARILGMAVSRQEDHYAQSFPAFGVERRGAPVLAFTKIDRRPILDRSQVYEPDAVVVLDGRLAQSVEVTAGLKPGGLVVINGTGRPPGLRPGQFECLTIDATSLALSILGKPIVNTAMAGALCAALDFVSLEALGEAIAATLAANLVNLNIRVAEAAYRQALPATRGATVSVASA